MAREFDIKYYFAQDNVMAGGMICTVCKERIYGDLEDWKLSSIMINKGQDNKLLHTHRKCTTKQNPWADIEEQRVNYKRGVMTTIEKLKEIDDDLLYSALCQMGVI